LGLAEQEIQVQKVDLEAIQLLMLQLLLEAVAGVDKAALEQMAVLVVALVMQMLPEEQQRKEIVAELLAMEVMVGQTALT
jgi:hypothetical protein